MFSSTDDLLVVVGLVDEQRQFRTEVRADQRRTNPAVLDAFATEKVRLIDEIVFIVLVAGPEADRGVRSGSFAFAYQRHAFAGIDRMLWTNYFHFQRAYCFSWRGDREELGIGS